MALSDTERTRRYQATRDAIMLRPAKLEGAAIRAAAADAGQSVQAYILEAIRERMAREGLTLDATNDSTSVRIRSHSFVFVRMRKRKKRKKSASKERKERKYHKERKERKNIIYY